VTAALQSSWKTISAALTFVDVDDDDDDDDDERLKRLYRRTGSDTDRLAWVVNIY